MNAYIIRRTIFVIVTLLLGLNVAAQNISVKSFRALPTDITASSKEGKRIDQNGQVAALIKVMTTEKDFVFEGGALGIVDTQQRVGEIWVWVPRGLRKITILHQQLGGLRDYFFPEEIEAERTYEMVLTTAKIETVVKEEVREQYLMFQITPPDAILEVDDEVWKVNSDGTAMKFVHFGTYNYRVRASDYLTDAGKVTVDDPDNTKVVKITLAPNFATVTLVVDADAEIWVNNEKKGVRTWTGPMGNGTYKIECKQAGHETSVVSKEITAEMSGQTITLPSPLPIYGSLNVESTPPMATLYIDGKEMGKTPRSVNQLLIGEHELKLVKEGFSDFIETITIVKSERKQVKSILSNGKEVSFTCNVSNASLFIDGRTMGCADGTYMLTYGSHRIEAKAEGYMDFVQELKVLEGTCRYNIKLMINEGIVEGQFSVSGDKKVYFSKGNLQYQAATNTWRFAEHQWDYVGSKVVKHDNPGGTVAGSSNHLISSSYHGWIDLFGWGTSGWNSGNTYYRPYDANYSDDYGVLGAYDMTGPNANADWGVFNAISNGGGQVGLWRTLTIKEWDYLVKYRKTDSGIRFAKACVNNVNGLILLPDNWNVSIYKLKKTNKEKSKYSDNQITATQWIMLEKAGAVFLPAAGQRTVFNGQDPFIWFLNMSGHYWSATSHPEYGGGASFFVFGGGVFIQTASNVRDEGFSVRLVCDSENSESSIGLDLRSCRIGQ